MRQGDDQDPDMVTLLRIDGGAGPAPPLGDDAMAALIGGALDAVLGPLGGGGGAAAASNGSASGSADAGATVKGAGIKAAWWGVGAVAMAAAGVTAWLLTRVPEQEQIAGADPEGELVRETGSGSSDQPEVTALVVPDAEPATDELDELELPAEDVDRSAPKQDRRAAAPEPAGAPARAEDLLAEANAARRRRDWKDADRLYSRVVKEHRGTGAAQVAQVASATIRLEHLGDAAGAARGFRAALAGKSTGPLAEEARYGLAEAYRALGNHDGESRALADFLRHHGDSPLADRARARQDALEKAAP